MHAVQRERDYFEESLIDERKDKEKVENDVNQVKIELRLLKDENIKLSNLIQLKDDLIIQHQNVFLFHFHITLDYVTKRSRSC